MSRTLVERIHNPRGRKCGCLPDCWCQSTTWGRALRWYLPKPHHTAASAEWKRDMQARRESS